MNNRIHNTHRLPRRSPLRAAIAAVTLTLAAPAALATEAEEQAQPEYGTHSQHETQPQPSQYETQPGDTGATQSFTALDQDGSGYLDEGELTASHAEQASVDNLDTDNDGQVSRTEFAALESAGAMGTSPESSDPWQSEPEAASSSPSATDPSSSSESSTSQSGDMAMSESGQTENAKAVAKIAEEEQSLSTFTQALKESGLADALTDETKYTIFAPTNDAFESRSGKSAEELMKPENREELVSLLRAHIVVDDVDEEMAKKIPEARTLDGGTVKLTSQNDTLQVGDASVVQSAIQQGSLRVYPIDAVLEPQPGAQTASATTSSEAEQPSTSTTSTTSTSAQQGQVASQSDSSTGSAEQLSQMQFDELDQDGNGYLSQDELQSAEGIAAADTATDQMDTDQDGQVSRTEFSAFEQSPQPETGQSVDEKDPGYESSWEVDNGDQPDGSPEQSQQTDPQPDPQ